MLGYRSSLVQPFRLGYSHQTSFVTWNNSTWVIVLEDMDKLKSRKLWITILATALMVLAKKAGIDLEQEMLLAIAGMVIAYVTGQAIVDRGKVVAEIQARIPAMTGAFEKLLTAIEADEESKVSQEDRQAVEKIVTGGYS